MRPTSFWTRRRALTPALWLLALACSDSGAGDAPPDDTLRFAKNPPPLLSAWRLFKTAQATTEPGAGVIPYDVNTPLFTDYALKYRYLRLPAGKKVTWIDERRLDFPVGAVLVKTFAYPKKGGDPENGIRLVETRLLVHGEDGWVGLPYLWNEAQDDAVLKKAGAAFQERITLPSGETCDFEYVIPNVNQCRACHAENGTMGPIGPKPYNLNRDVTIADGAWGNQISHLSRVGVLEGAPDPAAVPALARWDDEHAALEDRARAYLEANCAHCHNPEGQARNAGVNWRFWEKNLFAIGVMKSPASAGRGTVGLTYDLVPGKPAESIVIARMESVDPGIKMPELGRSLVDAPGVRLLSAWIAQMPASASERAAPGSD